ncbi:MAG: phosphopantothenoylcysteine decarboxylase [Planctomycetota bacterium]|nr:phosphopantothenoylcysteine decarboxylase [Planctomycetota bacterium]MDP6502818.1 phosphopantothenoylcysteine decarboxylase [Planctomycetota bacterium]
MKLRAATPFPLMHILVTAGPTREHIDAVRYLSNGSSGSMGYALAEAAQKLGHTVTLVSGPTNLSPPDGLDCVSVISARDMYREVTSRFPEVDLVIMNAAVCDYRPRRKRALKMKKQGGGLTLDLVPNPDILQALGRRKKHQRLMGFALETHQGLANAQSKLERKNLDWIVLNNPSAMGAERVDATLLSSKGVIQEWKHRTKRQLARQLVLTATRP